MFVRKCCTLFCINILENKKYIYTNFMSHLLSDKFADFGKTIRVIRWGHLIVKLSL
jgi:hypothetical protein